MQPSHLVSLRLGVVLSSTLSCKRADQPVSLYDRIVGAHTSQYCTPDACINPHILAMETGYNVTSFVGAKPQHANIAPQDLGRYLQSVPMQAWPRGPSISIVPSDVVVDQNAINKNINAAKELCGSWRLKCKFFVGTKRNKVR